MADGNIKHGHVVGDVKSPTYTVWQNMKARCKNRNHPNAKWYSELDITYDPRWEEFNAFLADMGEKPEAGELDRIDNSAGYWKENCRWVTRAQNVQNSAAARLNADKVKEIRRLADSKEVSGSGLSVYIELGRRFNVHYNTIKAIVLRQSWKNIT